MFKKDPTVGDSESYDDAELHPSEYGTLEAPTLSRQDEEMLGRLKKNNEQYAEGKEDGKDREDWDWEKAKNKALKCLEDRFPAPINRGGNEEEEGPFKKMNESWGVPSHSRDDISLLFREERVKVNSLLVRLRDHFSSVDFGNVKKIYSLECSLKAQTRMLDFLYRVVDPVKALAVLRADARERPYVIDQATGSRLPVPRPAADVPHEATAPAATGRVYYTLFANPGCLVKEGDKVTVVIGKFRIKDLVVQ